MKKVKILRTAIEDLLDGKEFYNFQSPGVGDYFMDTVFSEIDSLSLYGGIHPKRFGFYRQLSRRFPYAVYYDLDGDIVFVFHVLDCREDPRERDRKLLR
jgi:plasmid stabilization system protein ParE